MKKRQQSHLFRCQKFKQRWQDRVRVHSSRLCLGDGLISAHPDEGLQTRSRHEHVHAQVTVTENVLTEKKHHKDDVSKNVKSKNEQLNGLI